MQNKNSLSKAKRNSELRFETLEARHLLTSLFVALDGNDLQSKASVSINSPLATVQRATALASPGDTIFIREGVYRETAPTRSGTAGNPITYTAYNGENVIFSGGDLITGWTQVAGLTDVWVADVPWNANNDRDANTLFVNGELKFEAREHAEIDPIDIDDWGQVTQGNLTSTTLRANDLIGWGDDFWNGAKVRHHVNDFTIINSTIADYDSSTGTITFEDSAGIITQKQTNGYYIFDTINALDRPGEWYKGKAEDGAGEENKLYYKAEPGQDPNSLEIEFKRRAFGFDTSFDDYVTIEGITFRGVSIQSNSATNFNIYRDNTFYAYDKDDFGRFFIEGDDNVFRDNEVSQLWGSIITYRGNRSEFVNNLVVDTGYNGVAKGLIAFDANELLISHNTIRSFAEAFIDGYPTQSEIAYNVFEDGGKLTFDTGVFDADGENGDQSFSVFHHNIFRNTDSRGIYEAFYGRNDNAVIHHNLFYDFDGGGRPVLSSGGVNFGQVFHNTFITDAGGAPAGNLDARAAIQERYNNNVQISLTEIEALGVDVRGNFDYSASDFVNFNGDDYRLAAGSGAIDTGIVIPGINDGFLGAAPDAGAFEFGAPVWEAGHNFATPPNPVFSLSPLAGSNLYVNGQFNNGIGDWTVVSGAPNSQDRNSFNLQNSGASLTGTFRTESVEFAPGSSISREFTDLTPNTTYTLGVGARVTNRLSDANAFNASQGSITSGTHRGEDYVTDLSAGEWVRYDNVDFGAPGQFDQLDLLHIRNPLTFPAQVNVDGVTVQVRLDSANGPVIAEFNDLNDGNTADRWRGNRTDLIGGLSGTHSLYVSVSGTNATNIALGSFQLLKQAPPTTDLLSVSIDSLGANRLTAQVGSEDWQTGFEEISFTTGPAATSATIAFANNGRLDAYLDRIYLIEGNATRGAAPADISTGAAAERSLTASTSTSAPGVTNGLFGDEVATGDHANSWVQVDLGTAQAINSIKLTPSAANPTKLSNFRVSVWNADPDAGGTELWSQDYLTDGVSLAATDTLAIQSDSRALDGDTRLADVDGRFVRVQLLGLNNSGDNILALAELQVDGFDEANLAVTDGIARQSSTEVGGDASNANDGDASTVSATQTSDTNSWWQVRFPQAFSIGQIELVNTDGANFAELSNFTVSVWDEDPEAGGGLLWEQSYFSSGSVGQGATFTIDGSEIDAGTTRRLASNHTGRVVRVQLNGVNNEGNGRLPLAEVRVSMGDTDPPSTNLALDGVTTQRNDFYGDRGATGTNFGFSNVANDGVILPLANFSSALGESGGGWWQVDLQQATPIDQIVLFNRVDVADRLDDFWVEVWDGDPQNGGSILWDRFYQYSGFAPTYSTGTTIGTGGALIIDGSDTDGGLRLDDVSGGEYVRVRLTDSDILSLAEVQVWGPDALVRVAPDASSLAYDLGTFDSSQASGAEKISPYAHGDVSWVGDVTAIDRGGVGLLDDFVTGSGPATLNFQLPNGVWQVTVEMGDSQSARDDMALWANGALIADNIDTAAGQSATQVFDVVVSNGELSLSFDDLGGVDDSWVVNSIAIEDVGPAPVDLAGDFNGDLLVSAADYTVYRDLLDTSTTIPNDTTPGQVTADDYNTFANNFGATLAQTTTTLIDATTGNGDFTELTPNSGGTSVNIGGGRVLAGSGVPNTTITIPGWTITRTAYQGGNDAFGFDGVGPLGSNGSGGQTVDPVAFVNNDTVTLNSDSSFAFGFLSGDEVNLSFDLGTDTSDAAFAGATAQATLTFDAGLPSEFTQEFGVRTATFAEGEVRFTETVQLTQAASSVSVEFALGQFNGSGPGVQRVLFDNVELQVTSSGAAPATASLAAAAVSPAEEESLSAFPLLVSAAPAVDAASSEAVLTLAADAPVEDDLFLLYSVSSDEGSDASESPEVVLAEVGEASDDLPAIDGFFDDFGDTLA